jgi:hypothetical protein
MATLTGSSGTSGNVNIRTNAIAPVDGEGIDACSRSVIGGGGFIIHRGGLIKGSTDHLEATILLVP